MPSSNLNQPLLRPPRRVLLLALAALTAAACAPAPVNAPVNPSASLARWAAAPHRSANNVARDRFTLKFVKR